MSQHWRSHFQLYGNQAELKECFAKSQSKRLFETYHAIPIMGSSNAHFRISEQALEGLKQDVGLQQVSYIIDLNIAAQ